MQILSQVRSPASGKLPERLLTELLTLLNVGWQRDVRVGHQLQGVPCTARYTFSEMERIEVVCEVAAAQTCRELQLRRRMLVPRSCVGPCRTLG